MDSAYNKKMETCIQLIKNNDILVLATCVEKKPHTSLMAYTSSDDGLEIYMLSSTESKKWKNINQNPNVGIMIDDRDEKLEESRHTVKALTLTGRHVPIISDTERNSVFNSISKSIPSISEQFTGSNNDIIRIKVASMQLLDGPVDSFYIENIKRD